MPFVLVSRSLVYVLSLSLGVDDMVSVVTISVVE